MSRKPIVFLACLGAQKAFVYVDDAQYFFHLNRTLAGEYAWINEGQGHVAFAFRLLGLLLRWIQFIGEKLLEVKNIGRLLIWLPQARCHRLP